LSCLTRTLLDAGSTRLHDGDGETNVAISLSGSVLDVRVSGAQEVLGLRVLLPLVARSIERVNVNGAGLERRDSVLLEPAAPAG
jgi:hypothetical protein